MRLQVLCAFVLLSCSAAMFGQATHPTAWDVFAGGSYNRITNINSGQNLYGWDASVSERPYSSRRWVGGTIEGNGAYYNTSTTVLGTAVTTSYSIYTFMAGPVIAAPSGHLRPFVHALLGEAFQNASASAGSVSASTSSKNFAFAVGGGVDVSVNRNWGIRGQADWLRASQTGAPALNLVRAAAGVVVRF